MSWMHRRTFHLEGVCWELVGGEARVSVSIQGDEVPHTVRVCKVEAVKLARMLVREQDEAASVSHSSRIRFWLGLCAGTCRREGVW